jgi:hypothetical protein
MKFRGFLMNGDLPYKYSGSTAVVTSEKLISTALLITEMTEESL